MAKIYMFCVIKSPIDVEKFTRALGTTRMFPIDARLKKENRLKQARQAFERIGNGCEGFFISTIADLKNELTINDFYKA
jgi:hypothetical protein